MVEWNDPRVVVAICAFFVSAISFGWRFIKTVRKIKVQANHLMVFADNILGGGYTPAIGVLWVKATNYTNEEVLIKGWHIKTGKKIDLRGTKTNEISCLDTTRKIKYPYPLKKGEIFEDICGVRSIINAIGNQIAPNSKMRVIVSDTINKKFKSQKFTYKSLLVLLETEDMDLQKHNH
jgi:hypothetical protein